ncbi:MAG: hypothetical protein SAJ72_10545 [Jaaginema sp. PMC 1080.18]|nr:hypothetical protein [Jaaginema sp. PMC 1080.18]MEC4865886.1 hypothetical protein [Jaaginema sp. PMC 1078.18]
MKPANFSTSTCRLCNYYTPEGRRGGVCRQLGVEVRGCWRACCLGTPAFTKTISLRQEITRLEQSLTLDYGMEIERVYPETASENAATHR